jgi:N-acetyl-gamma-glutamyl-phosphate reductase
MTESNNAMPNKPIRAGVIGGSGYVGAEILRYLTVHPDVELAWVTANSKAGQTIADLMPNFHGVIDQSFLSLEAGLARIDEVNVVFVALPHNKAQEIVPDLAGRRSDLRIIDMTRDFRVPDAAKFLEYYGTEHQAPEWLERFSYGFTEFQRTKISGAQYVANPGCFATSLVLALAPLARAGKLRGAYFATGVTGSSGSGNVPSPTTHHPERAVNFRAYKPLTHQHLLEVNAYVQTLTDADYSLSFVPQSGPFVRGIFSTVFVDNMGIDELESVYHEAFGNERLIRVRRGSPDLRTVQGTARSEIGLAADGRRGVVFVTIDNLGKGAAGQAVQNLNCMFGLEPAKGLLAPGGFI